MRLIVWGACLGAYLGAVHILPSASSVWTRSVHSGLALSLTLPLTLAGLAAVFHVWLVAGSAGKRALLMGVTGFCYHLTALHWLGEAFVEPGQFYSPRAALGLFGSMWLFFPWWIAGALLGHVLAVPGRKVQSALALTAGMACAFLALDDYIFGIPLAPFALTALDTPVAGMASWIGQEALGTLILASGFLLGAVRPRARIAALGVVAAGLAVAPSMPEPRAPDSAETMVALVQPGEQFFFHQTAEAATRDLMDLVGEGFAQGATLVVLPENSLPFDLGLADDPLARSVLASVPADRFLLAGYTSVAPDPRDPARLLPFNTVALISGGTLTATSTKAHLVPFGEYMPRLFYTLGFDVLAGPAGGYGSGPALQVLDVPGLPPMAPVICYEAILSGAISRETAGATWLLNPTSERMFGRTLASRQMLDYVRLRAMETGLPVLRAASTGVTAHVDAQGRVLSALPRHERAVLVTRLSAPAPSPFRSYGQFPYLMALMALIVVLSAQRLLERCNRASTDEMEPSGTRRL